MKNQRSLIALAVAAQASALAAVQGDGEMITAKGKADATGMKKTLSDTDALAVQAHCSTPAFAINVLGKADKTDAVDAKHLHQAAYADCPQAKNAMQEAIAQAKQRAAQEVVMVDQQPWYVGQQPQQVAYTPNAGARPVQLRRTGQVAATV